MLSKAKGLLVILSVLTVILLAVGCSSNQSTAATDQAKQAYLTVQDSTGRTVTLPKKPERIVVLSPSFLDLLYAVGGQAVGRPNSKTEELPPAAAQVPEVGFVYNVNLEKVVSLQPDLVIAMQGMHDSLVPTFDSNHIPVLVLKYKTLDDTIETIRLLGQIAGTQAKAEDLIKGMQDKIQAITARLPAEHRKVAILFATSKSVTVQLERTIAGSIAQTLGLTNIAAGTVSLNQENDNVPYSLEKLVEADPDDVFVVTMGNATEIGKRMQADVESNPAWASLRAVKSNKVTYLPSDLFLLNPGLKMPEAVEYMAKVSYPEVYGSVK